MKKRTNRPFIALVVLILLSGMMLSGCGNGQPEAKPVQTADEHASPYVGSWSADVIRLKTRIRNSSNNIGFYDICCHQTHTAAVHNSKNPKGGLTRRC